jgi:hypothetical protein
MPKIKLRQKFPRLCSSDTRSKKLSRRRRMRFYPSTSGRHGSRSNVSSIMLALVTCEGKTIETKFGPTCCAEDEGLGKYTPTVTAQSSCTSEFSLTITRSEGSDPLTTSTIGIHLATNLPPKPDSSLCTCMMETLRCIRYGCAL